MPPRPVSGWVARAPALARPPLLLPLVLLLSLLAAGRARLQQHVCCLSRGPGLAGLYAQLPQALNHSAVQEVACLSVKGVNHIRKAGSACSYCACMHEDGANFAQAPDCCSLRSFGQPGVDSQTGHPMCQKYRKTYNLLNGVTRACELRYDLYHFAVTTADAPARRARLIAVALPLAGVMAAR
mmetsp:Transcript_119619/g.372659  ORF Transcript_119619/g.372659 Transcript_119619/m.372659 type:complete len:183 (-) Transcript_119619:4-552(-)